MRMGLIRYAILVILREVLRTSPACNRTRTSSRSRANSLQARSEGDVDMTEREL